MVMMFRKTTACLLAASILVAAGCGDNEKPKVTGPIEGKRLDGSETGANTQAKDAAAPAKDATTPVDPETASADAKKKRDEWRDKRTGKPDENDPIAQANIELRPALKNDTPKTAVFTPVQRAALEALVAAAEKGDLSPDQRASAEKLVAAAINVKLSPAEQASLDRVVAAIEKGNAAPSDPSAQFADPNNPNFVPADRNLWKKFDIAKLKSIDGYLAVAFADLSGFPYSGMVGAPDPATEEKTTDAKTADTKTPDTKTTETKTTDAKTTETKTTDAKTTETKTTDAKTSDSKSPETLVTSKEPKFTIPDSIKALDKKKVVVKGYMMPIDFEDGGTNEFVLTRNIPSCFYCQPPQLNDWVEVKMKDGKRVPYVPDGIIELYGVIEVGELREDGFIVNLYRMTGDKVVEMKE